MTSSPMLEQLPPDPWLRWTLWGLARHVRRQRWVADVLREHLGTDLMALSRTGSGAHPRHLPPDHIVPGLPDWKYFFHGIGCAFRRVSTGELIDVDFPHGSASDLNPWFYISHLRSISHPELPEARVLALHPSVRTVEVTMDALAELGLLVEPFPGAGPSRLHPEVTAHEDRLPGLAEIEAPAARIERGRWLRNRMRGAGPVAAVIAYAELDPPDLDAILDEVLTEPVSGRTSAALDVLFTRADAADARRISALLARLDPGGPIPEPHLWRRCMDWRKRAEARLLNDGATAPG